MSARAFALVVALMAVATGVIAYVANYLASNATQAASEASTGDSVIVSEFELVDQDGRTVRGEDLRGKYQLVFFGFTSCPDICPTALIKVGATLDELGPDADLVTPVLISVDPERDTPPVLKQFLAAFDPRILGLTGTPKQVAEALANFRAFAAKRSDENGSYTMDHTSFFYLMAPDGSYQGILAARGSVEELVDGIRVALPDPARPARTTAESQG